jgi:hypothetical protein
MIDCAVGDSLSQRGKVCLLTQKEDARNALAGPLTGPAHCALLRVVIRLAGLPRNGALALNIPPQSILEEVSE